MSTYLFLGREWLRKRRILNVGLTYAEVVTYETAELTLDVRGCQIHHGFGFFRNWLDTSSGDLLPEVLKLATA